MRFSGLIAAYINRFPYLCTRFLRNPIYICFIRNIVLIKNNFIHYMYSKDELLSKDIAALEDIAVELGIKVSSKDNQEDIIYSILDKQAEVESNKNPLSAKRRRTRIVKKDTHRVYSVNGKDGENFDLKKNKVSADTVQLFKDMEEESADNVVEEKNVIAEEVKQPEDIPVFPKHRGRKSKAELAARKAGCCSESGRRSGAEAA